MLSQEQTRINNNSLLDDYLPGCAPSWRPPLLRLHANMLSVACSQVCSNDKRFVIEEVQRALQILVDSLDMRLLLDLLLPYTKHRNPKVDPRALQLAAVGLTSAVKHVQVSWCEFCCTSLLSAPKL